MGGDELGDEGGAVGHRSTDPQAGDQAKDSRAGNRGGIGGGEAGHAEEEHRTDEDALAADLVSDGARDQGTGGEANEGGAEDGSEGELRDRKLFGKGGGDKSHRRGIEAVGDQDEKAQAEDQPLDGGHRTFVDELLYVEGDAGAGGGRQFH